METTDVTLIKSIYGYDAGDTISVPLDLAQHLIQMGWAGSIIDENLCKYLTMPLQDKMMRQASTK